MRKSRRIQLGAVTVVIFFAGIAVVSIMSAQAGNSNKNSANELNLEFESITKITAQGITSVSELEAKRIQNPSELNIPSSVKKYDVVTFDHTGLNSKIIRTLQIRIKGKRYQAELKRFNFENIDDGINSYRGKLIGVASSEIMLTIGDSAINGRVTVNNETFWIRPVEPRKRLEKGKSPLHIIYSSKDMESPETPAAIDMNTIKALYSPQSKPAGQQKKTIQDHVQVDLLVATDNQFYQDETDWMITAQDIIAEANNQFGRSDIQVLLRVVLYDDSKRNNLSGDPNVKSSPIWTFYNNFPESYLNSKSADIAIYLGGYDVDGYIYGVTWGYDSGTPWNRYAWAQMIRDWWGGGWRYGGSDHDRRVVAIHEIGHMFGAEHEDTEGYARATSWSNRGLSQGNYYSVMWSSYQGTSTTYEFSSPDYRGDSTHDNARKIRETKSKIANYT